MTDQPITAHDSQVASPSLRAVKSPLERLPVKTKAG
jgi:hypothetical protein